MISEHEYKFFWMGARNVCVMGEIISNIAVIQ